MTKNDLPIMLFASPEAWLAWLELNGATAPGLWLQLAKKDSGIQSINYAEALETALCYGWIDGQKKSYDAATWLQKFTPRGKKSIWSQINRDKAQALIQSGQMRAAGLAAINAAKADGRWAAAYPAQSKASVPEDLQAALTVNPRAAEFFATLKSAQRYAILFRIQTAKKPETRASRIAQFTAMLERHETLYP